MNDTPPSPEKIPQNPNSQQNPQTGVDGPVYQQPQPPSHPQANSQPMPQPQPQLQQNPVQPPNLNPETDRVTVNKQSFWSKYSGLLSIGQLVIGAVVLAFIINTYVFQSYQVFGESMSGTLSQGDRLIISKLNRSVTSVAGTYEPARGEIIVFKSPLASDIQLIKRVIGLPGERVVVKGGEITVYNDENPDGFNPDDTFEANLPPSTSGDIDTVVPEGRLFVSGDNRRLGGSLDSRNELGNIPIENVVGELTLRIFPLSQAKFF